jgi:DNA-directed RNA polymerase subunit RPC12/RpoP
MALTKCPDCGGDISTSAVSCPRCGCPIQGTPKTQFQSQAGLTCPHCGSHAVGKVRGLQGIAEVFICIILLFAFLIPGIIYYIYMESVPYCSGCGRRV